MPASICSIRDVWCADSKWIFGFKEAHLSNEYRARQYYAIAATRMYRDILFISQLSDYSHLIVPLLCEYLPNNHSVLNALVQPSACERGSTPVTFLQYYCMPKHPNEPTVITAYRTVYYRNDTHSSAPWSNRHRATQAIFAQCYNYLTLLLLQLVQWVNTNSHFFNNVFT